jgi:hypothetical protein
VPGLAVAPQNPTAAGEALFNAIVALLGTVEGFVFPSRVGFVPGAQVAFDGDQLTVNWLGMSVGVPGQESTRSVDPNQILLFYEFEINLLRQVRTLTGRGRTGGIPTPVELSDDALTLMADGPILLATVITLHLESAVVERRIPFKYGPLSALGPEGVLAGVRLPISFQAGVTELY